MAPHSMDTILQPPQWPQALSNFVTWCLMWDPKNRPTSFQAMQHEYFHDAVDPLTRPKSSSRLLGRKHSGYDSRPKEQAEAPALSTRSSWFRKSLIGRDSVPAVPQHQPNGQLASPGPSPVHNQVHQSNMVHHATPPKPRPNVSKRATWSNGPTPQLAPMPILPSIRPVSPLSAAVTAQAQNVSVNDDVYGPAGDKGPKKIGRQLSLASHGNHYTDLQAERERAANGLMSPTNGQKEGFFSHLRKRARRLSGRNQVGQSGKYDDIEASAGRGPVASNRSSMVVDPAVAEPAQRNDYTELDRALQNVHNNLDLAPHGEAVHQPHQPHQAPTQQISHAGSLKRHSSLTRVHSNQSPEESTGGPISSRTRRALHLSSHPANRYETPDEEEELLDEALHGAHRAVRGLEKTRKPENENRNALATKDLNRQSLHHAMSVGSIVNPYPTPSPSAKRNGMLFNNLMEEPATPLNINRRRTKENTASMWPTPPYEENEWANSASSSIWAASSNYR